MDSQSKQFSAEVVVSAEASRSSSSTSSGSSDSPLLDKENVQSVKEKKLEVRIRLNICLIY